MFISLSLGGSPPFLVDSLDLTKDNIVNLRYSFPVKYFRDVSEGAKELLRQLLVSDKRSVTTEGSVVLVNQN